MSHKICDVENVKEVNKMIGTKSFHSKFVL